MKEKFILENEDFDIEKILNSGQNVTYKMDGQYFVLQQNIEKIYIRTENNKTYFNISKNYFDKNLYNFFDMKTDYNKIREEINDKFPELKMYTDYGKGIRFINQDFLEGTTAFIISQNNNIKRIEKSMQEIKDNFGEGIFPSLEKLKTLSKEDFRSIGVGFRDKYLESFYKDITYDKIEELKKLSTKEAFIELQKYKGIGPKVANCILLFTLDKRDVFPVDVHIKRFMQDKYFDKKETNVKEIEEFALDKFKELSGYIQQYIFYYIINTKEF